ncbi:hypothetical protein V6N11_025364 [Hibiscus sabdariffa]|uniref:Uncharacterized protein n=2 Tax=Hibiscus sabdariffa TaxID=183260 RepID=A0ABR1Z9W8_9ROSI
MATKEVDSIEAKKVGSCATNVFDEWSMRTDNDLVGHIILVPEEVDVGMNKQPLPVLALDENLNKMRNISDEMLARADGALSTVGYLVQLGECVSEYNLRRVLIPSFDPGGSDATPTFIDTLDMSQIRIRASSRYWYASIDKQRQRLPLYKYRTIILYLVKSHATAIVVSETSNGETTQISQFFNTKWLD